VSDPQKQLVIYGAGGHGKVVADVALRLGVAVAGYVDDRGAANQPLRLGRPVLGDRQWLLEQPREHYWCALGIGDNAIRMRIGEFLQSQGFELLTLLSSFAVISPFVTIGAGVLVMPGAIINPDATIGDGVIVNTGAVVEHDCVIGRYANLSPNSTLGGGVEVGETAHVAIGATVMPYLRVGCGSTLGAGSVATRSIPDQVIAHGVPARVQRHLEPKNGTHPLHESTG
jgi:sugar O-acyltransferase (sialic acid O-acetyltransferase NeuD family)